MDMPIVIFTLDIAYTKTIALFVRSRVYNASDIRWRKGECAVRHLEASQNAVQCDIPTVGALRSGRESDCEELFTER